MARANPQSACQIDLASIPTCAGRHASCTLAVFRTRQIPARAVLDHSRALLPVPTVLSLSLSPLFVLAYVSLAFFGLQFFSDSTDTPDRKCPFTIVTILPWPRYMNNDKAGYAGRNGHLAVQHPLTIESGVRDPSIPPSLSNGLVHDSP